MDDNGSLEKFFQTSLQLTTDKADLVLLDDLLQKYAKFCSDHQLPQASNKCVLLLFRCLRVGLHTKSQMKACTGLAWVKGNTDPNYHHSRPESMFKISEQTSRIAKIKKKPTKRKLNFQRENTRTPEQELQERIEECKKNQLRVVLCQCQNRSKKYTLCTFRSQEEALLILSALGLKTSPTALVEQGYIIVYE